MIFASDNAGPAAPEIIKAVAAVSSQSLMPYGNDDVTAAAIKAVRALFEAPDASVHFVATGTAANALALSCMTRPWDAIFLHSEAHAAVDECGAPEFFTGGAKLLSVGGTNGKMDPAALGHAIKHTGTRGPHGVQRGPVTMTNITETGAIYSADETKALTDIAKTYGVSMHLDGARLSNACAALGASPAELTWKAGVDAVSFGGTKNGCMGVEAVIFFDPSQAADLEFRRKRSGHLLSKNHLLSAQMLAYASDGLWLDLAKRANDAAARLVAGLRDMPEARIEGDPKGNMIFAHLPRALHARAFAAGARYYLFPDGTPAEGPDDEVVMARFVCDWSCPAERVDALLDAFRG